MKGAVFIWVEQVDFPYPVFLNPPSQHGGVVGADWGIAEVMVKRAKLSFLSVGGVMAHGGEKESELLLVITEVSCAGGGFNHPDEEIRFGGGKEGVGWEKLVS